MAKSNLPARRDLKFRDLNEVVQDAEGLLKRGYDQLGNWDLSQISNHLANWLTYPVDGFPPMSAPIAIIMWMMRHTVGRKKLKSYLASGKFPPGKPTIPQTVFKPGGNEKEGVARLRKAAKWLNDHAGDIYPSPLFGRMTKDEAVGMQLVHCAHHLSFLVPKRN
jgi:Protein of unknown function (DUF1569)